jgi:hypothetical protein
VKEKARNMGAREKGAKEEVEAGFEASGSE